MKENKFRIWDDVLKILYTPEMDSEIKNLWEIPTLKGGVMKTREWIIVMQYIGLADKTGKEAYEKDLANYEYWIATSPDPDGPGKTYKGIGAIVFIEGCFMIEDVKTKLRVPFHYSDLSFEIIGNPYQNPELIEN